MVDNRRAGTQSALEGCFSSTGDLRPAFPGGMRLEAVMETLQRQQAARLALDDNERTLCAMAQSQKRRRGLARRHYREAVGVAGGPSPAVTHGHARAGDGNRSDDADEREALDEDERDCSNRDEEPFPREIDTRVPAPPPPQPHHEWTYEEQFKQLYELDDDGKRKEFLDDLFSFMQKRGTPVNRIPIMAKQVLDLYMLYKLVTEKGGLVEVINKKIWREITKGLNLPTSITSAAFTLRTQYMKYLYPYECEKRGLSSPGELQAAIDSNRREGRRQSYGSPIFNYSPVGTPILLSSPRIQLSHLPMTTNSQMPVFEKEDSMVARSLSAQVVLPLSPSGHHVASVTTQAATQAAAAIQAATLEQLRDKLEISEPPEKKKMMVAEERQRLMQQALQHNMLAMATQLPLSIKLNNRDDRQETALNLSTNGINSINMSIEINGVVYTGVLFARQSCIPGMMGHRGGDSQCTTQGKPSPMQFQASCASSSSSSSSSSAHGHRNSVSSP
ncbi:AT-rich interactive domain-containing protein 3A [Phyllopteryx taeniolatus]|uniref:AT-rich interactive domain-containing protein 3A n=1 Tax=Phyllopteryx taeniolatus TaxID=161469 RepID=UPI002AD55D24|nr:AT-rich interactive domain-containing protein 3A [Phyllopteryx taeniolatus]